MHSLEQANGRQARPVREAFTTSRMLDFVSEDELSKQIGADVGDWPRVAIKELVDNSLDACEEAGVTPTVAIDIDGLTMTVTDNGPGVTAAIIDGVLDFNSRISSREARVGPTRGAQGNALKGAMLMAFVLDQSKPGLVEIEALGVLHRISVCVNQIEQRPTFKVAREASSVKIGTVVRLFWPDSASQKLRIAMLAIFTDVQTIVACNPHAAIIFRVGGRVRIERAADGVDSDWRRWLPSQPAPPQWYSTKRFSRLISAMITHDRPGKVQLVRDFLRAEIKGMTSTSRLKAVLAATGLAGRTLEALVAAEGTSFDDKALAGLLRALCEAVPKRPKPEALGVLGAERMFAGMGLSKRAGELQYRKQAEELYDLPIVMEIAFAYDPELAGRRVLVGVNNSAALMGPAAVPGMETDLSLRHVADESPVAIFFHITGARISFTDHGKGRLALQYGTATDLVEAVTKKWHDQKKHEQRDARAVEKRDEAMLGKPERPATHRAMVLANMAVAAAETSGDGFGRFSQRALFYVMRRILQRSESPTQLVMSNFVSIVTSYENEHGAVPFMYRDIRGSIYIPHTKERIPLGTLSEEKFERPSWTFNKVLAIEKEGLFEALIESGWPERNDCALITSKGFFTRAGRDLIDKLPIEGEQLTIYCLHDADAAGTLIFEALAGATKARPARLVTVVNLGLDPWEGFAMGLECERVDEVITRKSGKPRRRPCGSYIDEQTEHVPPEGYATWSDWLQDSRFELDAMTAPQQAAYLDRKLEGAFGKVIPPGEHMRKRLLARAENMARERLEAAELAKVKLQIEAGVAAVMAAARAAAPSAEELVGIVAEQLAAEPVLSWATVVGRIGESYSSDPAEPDEEGGEEEGDDNAEQESGGGGDGATGPG